MKQALVWFLCFSLAVPVQVQASMTRAESIQAFLKQTLGNKKPRNVGEMADLFLRHWPERQREHWKAYFENHRQAAPPRVESDGDRLLVNGSEGSLIVDFPDPELNSVNINGRRVWMQDLLQINSGLRQIEKNLRKKTQSEFLFHQIFGEEAHALGPLIIVAGVAVLALGGYYLWDSHQSAPQDPPPPVDESTGAPVARVTSPTSADKPTPPAPVPQGSVSKREVAPSTGRQAGQDQSPSEASRADEPSRTRRLASDSPNRCGGYPKTAGKPTSDSPCDVTLAVSKYQLGFDSARQVFCGDRAWLAGVSSSDGAGKIASKVDEIERQYSAGLRQSLRGEYPSGGGAEYTRDETFSRNNFKKCVRLALEAELSGCNPNEPMEAVATESRGNVEIRLCPNSKRKLPRAPSGPPATTTNVSSEYFGATLRILTVVEGGTVQALNPCAIGRAAERSCAQAGTTPGRSSGPTAPARR